MFDNVNHNKSKWIYFVNCSIKLNGGHNHVDVVKKLINRCLFVCLADIKW